jgi:ribonuclease Z
MEDDEMRVTLLGTGSPLPSPERFGMSTLVQARGLNLVFDVGRGATIRLRQAGTSLGDVDGVFLTHFHSDHVNGLSDLWMTGYIPAAGGRTDPLDIYGTEGVEELAAGMQRAYGNAIDVRVADGELTRDSTRIEAHETQDEGVVFDQDGVKVTMFDVQHDPKGAITPAVGYRVDYQGKSVLLSGDTVPVPNIVDYGQGVDVLIHEVAAFEDPDAVPAVAAHHTTPRQVGEIFAKTRPRMAVYSHIVNGIPGRTAGVSEDVLVQRTRESYDGPLTVGADLTVFRITDDDVEVVNL